MRLLFPLVLLFLLSSCSEIEDNQRYLIHANFITTSNQPITDINMVSLRDSNFFNPTVLLGNGISDASGNVEFVSLVPTGSHFNMMINAELNEFGIQKLNEYSSIHLSIQKDLIANTKIIDLTDFKLKSQIPFHFQINKTSTEPALLSWQITYQSSSFCNFEIENVQDFNQNFECQNTRTISRTNDANNPNENLNISADEETILTFIFSLNGQENQVLEVPINANTNEFEFNY